MSFLTNTIFEAVIQVSTHIIMPQKINKKQVCEKIIGPSQFFFSWIPNVPYFDGLGCSLYAAETVKMN